MRVLMISKAVVVGIYQRKLEEIAQLPDVSLTVIVPPVWRDPSGDILLERAYTKGYDLLVEPLRFNGNFHLHYFPTLARRLHDLYPDVVHIDEEPYNLAAWHSLMLARRAGAKTLFFSWQNILKRYPIPFSFGERYVMNHVDYAIAGTDSAAEVWREKGYRGPLAVIPQFGVDPVLFSPSERPSDKIFTVGYVGRLVPEKGVDLLICALANLPGAWQLHIIGQGQERELLERLVCDLNLKDHVKFIGQKPSVQMPEFYRQLDVLVVPSRTLPNWKEQFGRVITEAMACGVAVIGADSGAIPDIIGDSGLIFPEDNQQALQTCLITLMQDRDLRSRLSTQGRARVLDKFTHARIAAQTVEVYHALLHKSSL
ncbi:MAG: glycosyltransferase [Chloroflexota bacterium]